MQIISQKKRLFFPIIFAFFFIFNAQSIFTQISHFKSFDHSLDITPQIVISPDQKLMAINYQDSQNIISTIKIFDIKKGKLICENINNNDSQRQIIGFYKNELLVAYQRQIISRIIRRKNCEQQQNLTLSSQFTYFALLNRNQTSQQTSKIAFRLFDSIEQYDLQSLDLLARYPLNGYFEQRVSGPMIYHSALQSPNQSHLYAYYGTQNEIFRRSAGQISVINTTSHYPKNNQSKINTQAHTPLASTQIFEKKIQKSFVIHWILKDGKLVGDDVTGNGNYFIYNQNGDQQEMIKKPHPQNKQIGFDICTEDQLLVTLEQIKGANSFQLRVFMRQIGSDLQAIDVQGRNFSFDRFRHNVFKCSGNNLAIVDKNGLVTVYQYKDPSQWTTIVLTISLILLCVGCVIFGFIHKRTYPTQSRGLHIPVQQELSSTQKL